MEVINKISWPYWLKKAWPFLAFAGAFTVVVTVVTFLFWYTLNRPDQNPPAPLAPAESKRLTPEEILERTTVPADAEPISSEKLEEVIENTTAVDEGGIAPTEEDELIDNTSVPTP